MYSMVLIMALNGQPGLATGDDMTYRSKHSQAAREDIAYRGRRRGGCCGCCGGGPVYYGGCYGGCSGGHPVRSGYSYGSGYYGDGYTYWNGYGPANSGYYGGYYAPYGNAYYDNNGYYRNDGVRSEGEYFYGPRDGRDMRREEGRPPSDIRAPREQGRTEREEPGAAPADRKHPEREQSAPSSRPTDRPGTNRPAPDQPTPDRLPDDKKPPEQGKKPPEQGAFQGGNWQLDRAYLNVRIPAEAQLFINDTATESKDSIRSFFSPTLEPGKEYTYVLRGEMMRDGQKLQVVKDVVVQPGRETRIDLNSSDFIPNK